MEAATFEAFGLTGMATPNEKRASTICRILLLRHARTASNSNARWHGQEDEPVSADGIAEIYQAGERLRALLSDEPVAIASSHLQRAYQTAKILSEVTRTAEVIQDERLRERDMGLWVGRSPAEVEESWPGLLAAWEAGNVDGPPGGESDSAVASRAAQALINLVRPGVILVVVTHGGVIRSIQRVCARRNDAVAHLGGYRALMDAQSGWINLGKPLLLGDPLSVPLT